MDNTTLTWPYVVSEIHTVAETIGVVHVPGFVVAKTGVGKEHWVHVEK